MARAIMNGLGMPAPRPRDIFPAMWYEMDRLFEPFERAVPHWPTFFRGKGGSIVLELDVVEHSDCITVEAELPGMDNADLAVTMTNGMLTIKGEKKQNKEDKDDKDDNYYLAERTYGVFERALCLPKTVDYAKIEAKFDNGVLKITAPKKPDAVEVDRKIEIRTDEGASQPAARGRMC
jgi:HSP20 family protein